MKQENGFKKIFVTFWLLEDPKERSSGVIRKHATEEDEKKRAK